MSHEIIEQLKWRYATKEFDTSKEVSCEDVQTLLDALILTPSSFGLQPWKFVVVKGQETQDKLVEASWGQAQVGQASHVIVICRPTSFGENEVEEYIQDIVATRGGSAEDLAGYKKVMTDFLGRKDEKGVNAWMKDQSYIALGNLMTVCATMKIDACPMEGFLPSKYSEILGLKEKNLKPVLVCPIGYRSENDKYSTAAKVRFSQEKLVEFIK